MFCIWLKSKKYCILNKEYSKEEYFKEKGNLIKKLKSQNKRWDPIWFDLSLYPYNDTWSYDIFGINKVIYPDNSEEIIDKNSTWVVRLESRDFISNAILDLWWSEKIDIKWRTKNKEVNISNSLETINSEDLPNIDTVTEDILEKVIICQDTWRPYKILKQELDYLKKKWLPLPRIHHEARMDKLFSIRLKWELILWICEKCNCETLTVFKKKPDYCKSIYCTECYKSYMYN